MNYKHFTELNNLNVLNTARHFYRALIKQVLSCVQIYQNHKQGYRKYLSWPRFCYIKKRQSFTTFAVITPVYNAEKYLDDLLKALTRQSLDFKKYITLILVNDGSTDRSESIILKWCARYPQNILYIKQANQGANAARNAGLLLAKAEWVTFIDADDFVHHQYFHQVEKCLKKYLLYNIKMLATRLITYREGDNKFLDNRPFRSFFSQDLTITPHNDLKSCIQLSVSSAFFPLAEIHRQKILFKVDSGWGSFEDAHFIVRYLKNTEHGYNLFYRNAIYYYRKRHDKTSYIDTSWTKKQAFIEVLEEGFLDILKRYKETEGTIPEFIQRTVLYDLSWKIKAAVTTPEKLKVLSPEEKILFLKLCEDVFSYFDKTTVRAFPYYLSGFWYFYIVGCLHCFMNIAIECEFAYIDAFDRNKHLIKIKYYSSFPDRDAGILYSTYNKKLIEEPHKYLKITNRKIFDKTFIYEIHKWIKLPTTDELVFKINGRKVKLDLGGKKYDSLSSLEILDSFTRTMGAPVSSSAPWILIDRDCQADDNAEHLYRYIAKNHPERRIYFALRKTSHDWTRLEKEEFNLINFGTTEYEKVLKRASKLISSHLDHFIVSYKKDSLKGKHYVCLQHGVTKDDLSSWLNTKKIDLFITSTSEEYQSIASDGSPYLLGKKEVVKTGLPRHDTLLEKSKKINKNKILLIMPTWRNYLAGKAIEKSHKRKMKPNFFESTYAKAWLGLLTSVQFKEIVEDTGFSVQFFPHFGMQPYFENIEFPTYLQLLLHSAQISIQEIFTNATCMLTDYSSTFFDMAFIKKAIVYYQFDKDEIYSGGHVYQQGYFDYQSAGFGPVCKDEESLLNELNILLSRGGQPADEYLLRMNKAFPIRDGYNCKRTYEAILNLDVSEEAGGRCE